MLNHLLHIHTYNSTITSILITNFMLNHLVHIHTYNSILTWPSWSIMRVKIIFISILWGAEQLLNLVVVKNFYSFIDFWPIHIIFKYGLGLEFFSRNEISFSGVLFDTNEMIPTCIHKYIMDLQLNNYGMQMA